MKSAVQGVEQLPVADAVLHSQWDDFLNDYLAAEIKAAALVWPLQRNIVVSYKDIELRSPEELPDKTPGLAKHLLERPAWALRLGNIVTAQLAAQWGPDAKDPALIPKPRLSVAHLPASQLRTPRLISSRDIGHLVGVQGLVTAASTKLLDVEEACFDCKTCGNRVHVPQEDETRTEPVLCDSCEKPGPWAFREEESRHIDMQVVRLQEMPETTPPGQTPETLSVRVYGDLAGTIEPGTRVIVNGILRLKYRRVGGKPSNEAEFLLEGVHFELDDSQVVDLVSPPMEQAMFEELARRPDVHAQLARCIAPSVLGLEDVKLALLYAFAGNGKVRSPDGSETRGRVHVMIASDPGMAKSRLVRRIASYVPRCIEVLGQGTNAVGLAAGMVYDDVSGEWMIEPGKLVLAHNAICAVDEFNLLDPEVRPAFNSCMEDGYVSRDGIKKTGQIPAEATIIGAMNPPSHRFDDYLPLIEQLGLEPALRSRFDLIFCLRDVPNKQRDAELARRQLEDPPEDQDVKKHYGVLLAGDEFRRYVQLARSKKPMMSPAATRFLLDYYVDTRANSPPGNPSFTPRQLDGLKRLAAASARLRLSETIELEDAVRARELMGASLRSCKIQDDAGRIDGNLLEFGRSSLHADRIKLVRQIVKDLQRDDDRGYQRGWAREADVLGRAGALDIKAEDAKKALDELVRTGVVYHRGGGGTYAIVSG